MKKTFAVLLTLCLSLAIMAQDVVAKDKYTVSGGLLGAVNLSKLRITGTNTGNIDYKFHTGWATGFWLNVPLSKRLSFEPQILLSRNSLIPEVDNGTTFSGKMSYISVPLLLKLHASKSLAFTVGWQQDILTEVKDKNSPNVNDDDFKTLNGSVTGGVELFPHGRVTIFGRYIHGLTNIDNSGNPNTAVKYYNQNIHMGLKLKLFGKHKQPAKVEEPPAPKDTDGDGIIDDNDKCPTVPGVAKYDGCPVPDTDGDGINDENDKCPTVPGVKKYDGCPVPDTDGDGINDENDKCPTVPGVAEYQGCPVPDRDKDGVPDKDDKCPDTPGLVELQGCPEITNEIKNTIDYAAKNVYFNTNSTKLLEKSFGPLDSVVAILNKNVNLKLKIDGHTDSDGSDDFNMKLSDGRAASVKAYLVSKGIGEERLESEGFGESMPVAPNTTKAGKAKNRRVEMKLSY